jgi:hypothetical protein
MASPVMGTIAWATVALELKVRVPYDWFATVGSKVKGKEQLLPGAIVTAHVVGEGRLKPAPETWMLLMISGALPQSVTLSVSCVDEPRVPVKNESPGKQIPALVAAGSIRAAKPY